jgi:hypothetical protein
MVTLLNLRTPPASMPASSCVLTESTLRRLSDVNAVSRTLRQLGYRIVMQQLRDEDGRPHVQIDSGSSTGIKPLLSRTGAPILRRVGDRMFGRVELDGVVVSWERA